MLDKTEFQPTEEKTNLIIKGSVKLFDVYKIPIDRLRYNAQNGRIATWISEHGDLPTDQEQFNATIEGYIYDAGPDTLNATKNNIEKFGQQEAAVVLSNGILVMVIAVLRHYVVYLAREKASNLTISMQCCCLIKITQQKKSKRLN